MPKHSDATDRLNSLEELINALHRRSEEDFEFKRAVGAMGEDLAYVLHSLRASPDEWRLNRAFHTVHVPSLLAIMAMLPQVDGMNSVSADERHQINQSIHRASQLATDSRKRIEQAKLTETKVELDVLAEYAPPVAEPLKQASTYERAFHGLKTLSENSLSTVSEGVSAVPGVFGRMKEGVSSSFDRAAAVPSLATNLHKTLSAAVSDTVTKPIEMRLQAGTKALKYGAGAGVGLGVATAILFPPLLPISAGGAVLAAMQGWRSQMDAARKLNEAEREQRIAELRAERSAALSKLTNGAACFQLETDEVNLTVDVEAGETDAVILKGEHSGRSWSQLSVAEKAEVVSMISDGADVVLRLLEFGRETL